MILRVYVQSIITTDMVVLVKATNGSPSGPPILEWRVNSEEVPHINIGTAYEINITRVEY
jgi:hypothetical protein